MFTLLKNLIKFALKFAFVGLIVCMGLFIFFALIGGLTEAVIEHIATGLAIAFAMAVVIWATK